MNNEPDRLLRPAEVAKVLGVTPESVRKLCESGKLRCVFPLGTRTRRVFASDLQAYLQKIPSNQDGNTSGPAEKLSIERMLPQQQKAVLKQEIPDVFKRLGCAKYFGE